jgi:hypothetical protein
MGDSGREIELLGNTIEEVCLWQIGQFMKYGVSRREELAEVAPQVYEELLRREKACIVEHNIQGLPKVVISSRVPKGELHVRDKNTGELLGKVTGIGKE